MIRVRPEMREPILEPCELEGYEYQVDTYIGCEHRCSYCYALNQAQTDWGEEIRFHHNLARRFREALRGIKPQTIYFGWNSDPYQPAERVHRQTRQALQVLAGEQFSACVLTKSALVTRDIDLFMRMPDSSVGFSLAFQDEEVRQIFEPYAPDTQRRVEALVELGNAGVQTYVLIAPVIPLVTDVEALIDLLYPSVNTLWFYGLRLASETHPNWLKLSAILNQHFPNLTEAVRGIAFSPDHPHWGKLRHRLERIRQERGLDLRIGV